MKVGPSANQQIYKTQAASSLPVTASQLASPFSLSIRPVEDADCPTQVRGVCPDKGDPAGSQTAAWILGTGASVILSFTAVGRLYKTLKTVWDIASRVKNALSPMRNVSEFQDFLSESPSAYATTRLPNDSVKITSRTTGRTVLYSQDGEYESLTSGDFMLLHDTQGGDVFLQTGPNEPMFQAADHSAETALVRMFQKARTIAH